ncbi:MAG: MerR family transcriptional regulator [Acidobacteriaceae bacterium]|nr:MerR family transcriptional regulator [Acidobacteriaceae bacterium]
MALHQPIRDGHASGIEIPDKLYFRIGEVARLCDVPTYVLRFWESEFPQLRPNKGGTGQRLYRRRDVEMALHIKALLYDEGYTIPGARLALKSEQKQKDDAAEISETSLAASGAEAVAATPEDHSGQLRRLQQDLRELLEVLAKSPADGAKS